MIDILIIIYLFIVGLVMGSFYTVVGLRAPLNESIVYPGSHCTTCNHKLKWYELIPVLSFIIQGGRCRSCKTKLSYVYPIIELLCGVLFAFSYYLYGFSFEMFTMLVISSVLIIIFVSDFKYFIILDSPLVIGSILVLILKYVYFGFHTLLISLLSGLFVFLFMYGVKLVGDKVFKRESLGGGDIKLSAFFGFCVGIRLGLMALILGCFLAFPYAIYSVAKENDNEIPFGPFLITGLMIVFLLETLITNFIDLII